MVTSAASVEWTVVSTEVEALQLEYSWIKEYDPRFNVKYRDDKSYPYLAVTLGEEFPRAQVMRGAKRKGTRYFGPYAHAWAIRETLDLLLRVFPLRTCSSGVFKRAGQVGRPCLLGYIDKCSAPCVGRVSPEEHRAIAEDFCDFMAGNTTRFVKRLERDMAAASEVPGVRAGGPAARRPRGAGQGAGEVGRRAGRRHGRRRVRARGRRARGRGPGLPRPRRPGPRAARLGGRDGRRDASRRSSATSCSRSTAASPATACRARSSCRCSPTRPTPWPSGSARCAAPRSTCGCPSGATSAPSSRRCTATPSSRSRGTSWPAPVTSPRAARPCRSCRPASTWRTRRCGSSATTSATSRAPRSSGRWSSSRTALARKSEYRRFVIRGEQVDDTAAMDEVLTRRFQRYLEERDQASDVELGPDPEARTRADRPRHRQAEEVRLPAQPRRRRRRAAPGQRGPGRPRPPSASTTSPWSGWPSGWRRSGCRARTTP